MHPQLLSDVQEILSKGYQLNIFKVVIITKDTPMDYGAVFYGNGEPCPIEFEGCSYGSTIEQAVEEAVGKWWEGYNKKEVQPV